jgi:hypothetical protein
MLLLGCTTTVPVKIPFPKTPEDLKQSCPALKSAKEDTRELSQLLETIVDNYATYYECAARVSAWQEWYETQRKIFEGVK